MGIRPTATEINAEMTLSGLPFVQAEKSIKYRRAMLAIEDTANSLPKEIVKLLEMMVSDFYLNQ